MTSRCKDTTHARRSKFDLDHRLTIKVAVWYLYHVFMYWINCSQRLLLKCVHILKWYFFKEQILFVFFKNILRIKWLVIKTYLPQVVWKQTARMSMLILVVQLHVASLPCQLWCQVTEHAAHLQAWQLQVPAGATWPLSFKWPTCFPFRSIHILLNLLFASSAFH